MKNILVTGANGFVGSHLVEALVKKKMHVRCLVRKTSDLRWLEHLDVTFIYGELFDYESLSLAVRGVDTVFHCAGRVKGRHPEEFLRSNAEGTEILLQAIRENAPALHRFVLISSQAAAGPSPENQLINETATPNPVTWYGKSKRKAEEIVLSHAAELPVVILRPSTVYGPRDTDVLQLFKTVQQGFNLRLGIKPRAMSLVHVDDLVQACLLAAEHPKAAGEVFFIISQSKVFVNDFVKQISESTGKKPISVFIPMFLFYLILGMIEIWSRITGKISILYWQKLNEYRETNWICDGGKAERILGFSPKVALEQGIEDTIAWYRSAGWLS